MYGVGQSSSQGRGWWIIIGVGVLVLMVGGLFFAFYTLVLQEDGETPTATVTMTQAVAAATDTVPAPTDTATSAPLATPTTEPTIPPTNTPVPATPTLRPPPEVITIGVRARVNISAGKALNLRNLPTTDGSTVITQLAPETEVDVLDGPEESGDLRWWNVNGGDGRVGWVVDAFGGETWLVPVTWTDQATPLSAPSPEVTTTATVTPTVAPPAATETAVVTPTATLEPTATATTAITPTATPVLTPTATPEGGIPSPTVGGRAQVTTQYQFVNLRDAAGLSAETIGQLQDGTLVTILEGPEEADNIRWWKVDDGQGNVGWVAERAGTEVLLVPVP